MTQVRIDTEVYIPYETNEAGEGLDVELRSDPTQDGVLTTEDLQRMVSFPTMDEMVRGEAEKKFLEEWNNTILVAAKNRAKNFGFSKFNFLKSDQVHVSPTSEEIEAYADRILSWPPESKNLYAYFRNTQNHPEPWVHQIMVRLAEKLVDSPKQREAFIQRQYGLQFTASILDDVTTKGAKPELAGRLFNAVGDSKEQEIILSHIQNIGTASRIFHWAEVASGNPESYNQRISSWTKDNQRVALVVGTTSGTGIDSPNPKRQDDVLKLFENYYANQPGHWGSSYNELRRQLTILEQSGKIGNYYVGYPNANNEIGSITIDYHSLEKNESTFKKCLLGCGIIISAQHP